MMIKTFILVLASCPLLLGGVKSGKAEAEWLTVSDSVEAGHTVQTAFRMVVDEHWHTYWSNPGEGGMKLSVKWTLPPGWQAGVVEHPFPKRFMTGELAGFGYEGEVLFPVTITAAPDFTGDAEVKGRLSWLTCNDDQCIPGNAELVIKFKAGSAVLTQSATIIQVALTKIPNVQNQVTMQVTDLGEIIQIDLKGDIDPQAYDFFPLTPQVVDSAATFYFKKSEPGWTAKVKKSEYATDSLKSFTLVFVNKKDGTARYAVWDAYHL